MHLKRQIEGLKLMKTYVLHIFFMKHFNIFHIPSKKLKNLLHHSQTNTKVQQENNKMEIIEMETKEKI
jgi:hypothetical protein